MSAKRLFSVAIASMALLTIIGCQSSMSQAPQSMAAPQHAILISGGNSSSTIVYIPSSDPNNPVMLCSSGTEECPECKAAAIKYFQTGVLEPKCSRTGATRTIIVPSTPNVGHQ
jgi:hypothetical protein